MHSSQTCSRCKQVAAVEGDLWCSACTAWEAIGRELAVSWDQPGCRIIAADLTLNCARQLRALRSLGAGITRTKPETTGAGTSTVSRGGDQERSSSAVCRVPLERKRKAPPPPVKRETSEEEEDQDLQDEDEESEEEPIPTSHHRSLGGSDRRPPEPEGPPPDRHKRESYKTDRAGSGRAHRTSEHSSHRSHTHHGSRRPRRRAGRKHQRLHRLAENPHLIVHRKLSEGDLELSCHQGRAHLDRDIL